jgi:hypothetical protein
VPFSSPVGIWDTRHIPEIVATGRRAVEAHREEILSAIRDFS